MFPHHRDGGDPLTRHNYYNYVNIIIYYERRSVPTIQYNISRNIRPRTTRGVHITARSQYIKLNPRYTYIIITTCSVTRGTTTVSPTAIISSLSV